MTEPVQPLFPDFVHELLVLFRGQRHSVLIELVPREAVFVDEESVETREFEFAAGPADGPERRTNLELEHSEMCSEFLVRGT